MRTNERQEAKYMKKVLKRLLGAFGICIVVLCIGTVVEEPERRAALEASLETAVELETPVLLPENEGKIVIVHGRVKMTAPAYDPEIGIAIQSPAARRLKEVYKVYQNSDDEDELRWTSVGVNEHYYGGAILGEFDLTDSILKRLPTSDSYDGFSEDECARYHVYYGISHTYISEDLVSMEDTSYDAYRDWDERGAERYSYWVFDPSDEITLVARQRGNQLVEAEELSMSPVHNGVLDKVTILENDGRYMIVGLILGTVAGLICVFFGFRDLFFNKNKRRDD